MKIYKSIAFASLVIGTVLCIVGGACSMIYATAMGSYILGIADTFLNQIALLIGVICECILFAWIFDAGKIIP